MCVWREVKKGVEAEQMDEIEMGMEEEEKEEEKREGKGREGKGRKKVVGEEHARSSCRRE